MFDLTDYMNAGLKALLLDALKVSASRPAELKFLRAFSKNLEPAEARRAENEKAGLHVPPFLIASITSNCNLFCSGCYARANQSCAGETAAGKPMNAERWGKLFEEAEGLGVCFILLAGGEPLLRPDVLKAAAERPGIIFPVFTNGTLFEDNALRLFDERRNLLPVISIEGEREATDARRGAGVHDRIEETVKALAKRKILFGASITVTKNNIGAVTDESFVRSLKKRGCGMVFYIEYVPSDNESAELAPGDAERKQLEERIERLKRAVNMLFVSFPGDEKYTGGCLAAGRGFVHVNMDGSVEPCPFSPYSDTNLADISLAEALKSPFLTSMREGGFLLGEHDGGCLLFEKREEVEELLKSAKNPADRTGGDRT
jgi:MoaA/NifB/PqqE/SkfB family radical SAM enzyme